ncbi:MAG: hypothetical protein R2752_23075 [Vicinamibacterales bacterium]
MKSVLLTALDGSGAPVRGLGPTDFMLREDGQDREVAEVTPATDPQYVLVLIDTAQPPMGQQAPVRDMRLGLTTFVQRIQAANPASQIALMEIGGAAVTTVKFTAKAEDLEKSINRLFPSQRSETVLLEGLMDAAKDMGKAKGPRRAIVSLTFASREGSRIQPRDVAMAVQQAGASYWAISVQASADAATAMSGLQNADEMGPAREAILENLPPATGGQRITAVSATGLESIFGRVADALTAQYVVTYARPDGAGMPQAIQARAKGASTVLMAPWIQ